MEMCYKLVLLLGFGIFRETALLMSQLNPLTHCLCKC